MKVIGTLSPRPEIRSGFHVRMLGWSADGSECYAEIFGNTGATSDTSTAREFYRVDVSGQTRPSEISSVPEGMVSTKNGVFDAKRRLQVWPTNVSIKVWKPDGPQTTVLFRLDPRSGQFNAQ